MHSFSVNKYMFNERHLFILFYALYFSLVKIKLKHIILHTSYSHYILFYTVDKMSSQQQPKLTGDPQHQTTTNNNTTTGLTIPELTELWLRKDMPVVICSSIPPW